jgi:small membrane protein
MNWIKVLLIVSFLCLLGWGFRHRAHVGLRAGMRLAAIALTGAAIASVINPDLLTSAANDVGVTRGTDLVLYIFIVIFVAVSIGTYFRFREQDRRLVEVVRASAIRESILSQGMPGGETQVARARAAAYQRD